MIENNIYFFMKNKISGNYIILKIERGMGLIVYGFCFLLR